MDETIKTLLYQILGYMVAMVFSFLLMNYWQRGYFWAYVKVRTSIGKLILVKLIGPTKIIYQIGRIVEGDLIWGKTGKEKCILNNIKRDYIYREQNVDCVDIDSMTYAFIPKDLHFIKKLELPEDANPEDYATVFNREGNQVIIAGVEGWDAKKVDSFIHAAQLRPSQMHKLIQLIVILVVVGLIVSGAGAFGSFLAGDAVKKLDAKVMDVDRKVTEIKKFIDPPQIVPTGGP